MDYKLLVCCAVLCVVGVVQSTPQSRAISKLVSCGLAWDVQCFLDTADDFLEQKRTDLLAEADREALATGRAEGETPSQLASTISRIISELTELFQNGFSGIFKSAREGDEDDEVEDDETAEDTTDKPNEGSVESRGKKKKEKLKGLIKLLVIGIVLKAAITLLLKVLSAALQVKFFLVALAGLILNAARFYLDLKKGHQPQKVIYYEHAQHQHHYDGGEDDWGSSGPGHSGGYWGRSYDEDDNSSSAQDLAYAKQKPAQTAYTTADSKPNSWFN